MRNDIDLSGRTRCKILGEYLVEHQTTVRGAAAAFEISNILFLPSTLILFWIITSAFLLFVLFIYDLIVNGFH